MNCYVFFKINVKFLPFDNLINVYVNFYSWNEVALAKSLISERYKNRMPKHNSPNREKSKETLTDLLRIDLDPSADLPVFYVTKLSRLPPVGVKHVDIAALLQQVSALRNEVRSLTLAHAEIREIHSTIHRLEHTSLHATRPAFSNLNSSMQLTADESGMVTPASGEQGPTFASNVINGVQDGSISVLNKKPSQQGKVKSVIGKGHDKKLLAVSALRKVELFVTRLEPGTTIAKVEETQSEVINNDDDLKNNVINVKCEQLETRYNSNALFHISVATYASYFARN